MIRAGVLGLCLLAPPAAAQEMTQEVCTTGWRAFNELIGGDEAISAGIPDVTPEGWCRTDAGNTALTERDFTSLEWRAEGVMEAVAQKGAPLSFQARFTGIDPFLGIQLPRGEGQDGEDAALGTMVIDATRDAATRDFALRDWTTRFPGLGALSVSLSGGGLDLSSLERIQMSSGGMRIHALDLELETEPGFSAILFQGPVKEHAAALVRAIPEDTLDEASRAALLEFVAAGSGARGDLRLAARSETGLGLLQLVGGTMPFDSAATVEEVLPEAMAILFRGVSLRADWQPDD